MAIIGKIRDKGWLVLVVVGLALVAFILGDYWKNDQGSVEEKYGIGTIYGEKVDPAGFEDAVKIANENAVRAAQQQQQQSGRPVAPQAVDRNAVWKSYVDKLLLEQEFEALGIEVSAAEFDAYLYGTDGFEVMQELKQSFTDSTGFNLSLLQARIQEMEGSDDAAERQNWEDTKEYYIIKRKQEKYYAILNSGFYVSNLEAKQDYLGTKEKKSVSYVAKRYREIKDADIDASDEKLKAYFEKHKSDAKYANKTGAREVHFFDITVEPSKADSTRFNSKMDSLKAIFASTTNDSLFVMKHSDQKFYNSRVTYRVEGDEQAQQGYTYPRNQDTTFSSAQVGDVVGPYTEAGVTKLAKIVSVKDKAYDVRHILISAQRENAEAVAKAQKTTDSLMAVITSENFETFVPTFSTDPGSNQKGGKYENVVEGQMVPEFNTFILEEPIGKIGYVQTDYGFHIMEVLGKKETFVPNLAIIQKTLKPSFETISTKQDVAYDLLYLLAEKLEGKSDAVAKVAMFDSVASQNGFFARPINIQDNSPALYGFTSKFAEEEILELAFNSQAKEGDLVGSPIKDKNKHVIAILSSIREEGATRFEDVKQAVKKDYIQEKKAARFLAKMKNKGVDEVEGGAVQKAEVSFGNAQIDGAGFEPEVLGAIFSELKDGDHSQPIIGRTGVFIVRVDKTIKAKDATDYSQEKARLLTAMRASAQNDAKRALTKQADVIDNRRLSQKGIRR